jgi:hypothetical protein
LQASIEGLRGGYIAADISTGRPLGAPSRKLAEEIVAKLRQVDVLVSQGQNRVDAIRHRREFGAAAAWPLVASRRRTRPSQP